jgi:hypothetical protein
VHRKRTRCAGAILKRRTAIKRRHRLFIFLRPAEGILVAALLVVLRVPQPVIVGALA